MSPARVGWMALASALAAVLLYFALRGIDWHQLGRTLAATRPALVGLTCSLGTVTLALRAARWRILLNAEGDVGYRSVFWATAAGYFGNSFLPARAGELVRTFLITSASGLDMAYVLATALSERVADAITLVLIASAVLTLFPAQAGWLSDAARPFAALGLSVALVVALLPLSGTMPHRIAAWAPVPPRYRPRAVAFVDSGIRGLRAFHSADRLSGFLLLTAVVWTIDALAAVVAAAALGLHLSLPVSFLMLSAFGLASAVPSTPGYVGVYPFVAVVVLSPFGFSRSDAIAFIVVLQATSYGVNALWGSIGMARYRRAARRRTNA